MQGIARFVLAITALALVSGCQDKNKDLDTEPAQGTSAGYESPSPSYYAPDMSSSGGYGAPSTTSSVDAPAQGATHVVARGETLSSLARMYYSDQKRWKDIYNANSAVISDPNKLRVGQELIIP